jgi:cell division protein FtsW
MKYLDKPLLYAILLLIALGLIMVYSATYHNDIDKFFLKQHFFKQLIFVILGFITAWILLSDNRLVKNFNTKFIYNKSWWFFWLVIILLVLVFLPYIGKSVNGSDRWLNLIWFTFQPSELAKLTVIITIARMATRQNIRGLMGIFKTLALSFPFIFLIVVETDFGATAIITATAFAVLLVAGAHLGWFGLIIAILAAVASWLVSLDDNRVNRIYDFFAGSDQGIQALVGIVRGDLFGVGLGSGLQKISKLSEIHTDMIFSLIAEELGLISIIIVISLYFYIYLKGFKIAATAVKRGLRFESYLAFGICFWLSSQTLYNILMNLNFFPIKGFTLPLISYGGSSMLITIMAMAILLKIDITNKKQYV